MDWCFRLSEEQRGSFSSHFLTLTYESAPADLVPKDLQDFTKRLRTFQARQYDGLVPLRYYSVGEYGELRGRPHYHSIMFNMIPHTVECIEKIWRSGYTAPGVKRGAVHVGTVTGPSIGYVTAYCINRFNSPGREPPFSRMSKNPGIGANYLTPSTIQFHKDGQIDDVSRYGVSAHMARYYRYRIFDYDERLLLRARQLAKMESQYEKDIQALSKFSKNPYYYYGERQRFANDVIGSQLNYTF